MGVYHVYGNDDYRSQPYNDPESLGQSRRAVYKEGKK